MKTTTLFCILATQTISPPLGSPAVASSWVLQNKVLAIWSYNFGSGISLNWDMLIQFTTLSEGKWQPGRTSFCVFRHPLLLDNMARVSLPLRSFYLRHTIFHQKKTVALQSNHPSMQQTVKRTFPHKPLYRMLAFEKQ